MNDKHLRESRKISLQNTSKQPKAWHHQQELTSLLGKRIKIVTTHGSFVGDLVAADQFTLKIDMKGVNGQKFVTLFKSAMTYFHAVKQEKQDD